MARKIVNRKALRDEIAAAESAGLTTEKVKKKPAKRKSRAKEPVDIRVKLFWGVYNQSMKRVAAFEYAQKKEAEAKAESLGQGGKTPHFIQKFKETIDG